jgi:hypothetical protein
MPPSSHVSHPPSTAARASGSGAALGVVLDAWRYSDEVEEVRTNLCCLLGHLWPAGRSGTPEMTRAGAGSTLMTTISAAYGLRMQRVSDNAVAL